jgi:hypothetical protein
MLALDLLTTPWHLAPPRARKIAMSQAFDAAARIPARVARRAGRDSIRR